MRNGTDTVEVHIDDRQVPARAGATILEALQESGLDTPTLCYLENLTPVNVCRVCVVELEGSRALVPSCSRKVEAGMSIRTDTERVRHSRKLVFELLASSVDLSLASEETREWMRRYGADPDRFGQPVPVADEAPGSVPAAGHHHGPEQRGAERLDRPVLVDNDLYIRDYSKCILCYKCVEACGVDAQNTFAIAVAGRGFQSSISTEFNIPLTSSACVYCGNCIGVCPTGALLAKSEHDMREAGEWKEAEQTVTDTVCPYCGVGCNLRLTVQNDRIVKASSPIEHDITRGHLCIKGRFGWEYVNAGRAGGSLDATTDDQE